MAVGMDEKSAGLIRDAADGVTSANQDFAKVTAQIRQMTDRQ
jgi:hypothetical protein